MRDKRPTFVKPTFWARDVSPQARGKTAGMSQKFTVCLVRGTVGQLKAEGSQNDGVNTATHPGPSGQDGADPVVHDDHVSQGITDGDKAVKGHHCVQEALSTAQEMVEGDLGQAALKRDTLTLP